ncbi:MAG: phosphoribosyl-AMP cyclohydrolase [Clostridia bacterium]|nr:phosphoribosyl-AMP cyclohydrolase [Clostridia bacterium]
MDLSKYFKKSELIPVIVQDVDTKKVLMLGYTNEEAFKNTLETKTVWFYSRSRNKLWNKGETSGNFLFVREIYGDCDDDTILILATPKGPTCHTGRESCFFNEIYKEN